MKKGFIISLIIVGAIILLIIISIPFLTMGMGEIRKLVINEIYLNKLNNGTYTGEYKKARWKYEVEVVVKNKKIKEINITNDKMKMFKEINNEIIKKVIDNQSINVDTYTGATITSKALLKSIDNALNK